MLLGKHGFRAATLVDPGAPPPAGCDVLIANAESRALPPDRAAAAAGALARQLLALAPQLIGKRIDSTLRGNLGAETDALLDALGPEAVALVVPAFPASGRTTVGGRQFVHGLPLEETEVRHDPTCPVTESDVAAIVQRQSRYPVAYRPPGAPWPAGARIIVCDAATDDDLTALAAEAAAAPFRPVPVDPGPFTAALGAAICKPSAGATGRPALGSGRVLVVAGSRSPLSDLQLATLPLLEFDPDHTAEESIAARLLAASGPVAGVRALGAIHPGAGPAVADALGRIARRALEGGGYDSIYTTGGDVTVAVCRALEASAIELLGEVLPLASYGRLSGGPFNGLAIVTKGGLVGGTNAAMACVTYLQQRMN